MENLLKIISAALVALLLTGCPDQAPSKKGQSGPSNKVIFVKGDPSEIIRGAQANPNSPLTEENIEGLNDYSLLTLVQFVEKEEVIKRGLVSREQLQEENKPIDKTEVSSKLISDLRPEKTKSGQWRLSLFGGESFLDLQRAGDGSLQIVGASSKGGQKAPLSPVHWSISKDKNFISVLLRAQDEKKGRSLVALYFEKKSVKQTIEETDKKYSYFLGPGKKAGWKKAEQEPLNISYCGGGLKSEIVQDAVSRWEKVLRERLPIAFEKKVSYAPFSDLNQHCIYIIDTYMIDASDAVAKYGSTYNIISLNRAEIIDSDIFIFKAEFQKQVNAYIKGGHNSESATEKTYGVFPLTIVHEVGHMLGLDHKFDGTPSVMSYEFKYEYPQTYDIEALNNLYPKVLNQK